MDRFYTTFEVSKLCGVALTTVISWVNGEKLPAFKTPGGHRRIKQDDLLNFLKKYEMPIPGVLARNKPDEPKILIVDDDALTLKILSKTLRGTGRIITAADGFTAGTLVEKELPDIILLDIFLPGIDGIEICRRIKSSQKTRHIKIIGMTAYFKTGVREKILAAGADECLSKPFDPDYIRKRVAAIVGAPQVAAKKIMTEAFNYG